MISPSLRHVVICEPHGGPNGRHVPAECRHNTDRPRAEQSIPSLLLTLPAAAIKPPPVGGRDSYVAICDWAWLQDRGGKKLSVLEPEAVR